MAKSQSIDDKIKEGDCWYTNNQLELTGQSKYTNENREKFLSDLLLERDLLKDRLTFLDAGSGDGYFSKIIKNNTDFEVIGVEYNPLRVERFSSEDFGEGIRADLRKIPFKNGSIDIIWSNHAIEHIDEDEEVLKEFYGLLRDEGLLILGTPNEGCLMARIRNNYMMPNLNTDHVNFYTSEEFSNKIESAGFEIEEVRRESIFLPHSKLNSLIGSTRIGWTFLDKLGDIFKSQCAGFHFVCEKRETETW